MQVPPGRVQEDLEALVWPEGMWAPLPLLLALVPLAQKPAARSEPQPLLRAQAAELFPAPQAFRERLARVKPALAVASALRL